MADRRVSVSVDAKVTDFVRGMTTASAATKTFAKDLRDSETRMSGMVQTSLALGPALVPVAAAAAPAFAALTAQLGAAATATGVALLAFNGMGDALKTLSAYQLEPTAENLDKMRLAMEEIGPAGEQMARFLNSLGPQIDDLQSLAREGFFPGVEEGLTDMLQLMPQIEQIIGTVAETMGDLSAEAGEALAGDKWESFFSFIGDTAAPTLDTFARTIGNVAEGLGQMMIASGPMGEEFANSMLNAARGFNEWATSMAESNGFAEFASYAAEVGPQVADTLAAIGSAFVELVQAAAPVGAATLPVIELFAEVLGAIADTPAGPQLIALAAALSMVNRSIAMFNAAQMGAIGDMFGKIETKAPKAAAALRGFGLVAAGISLATLFADIGDVDYSLGELQRRLELMAAEGRASDLFNELGFAVGSLGEVLHSGIYNDIDFLNRKLLGSTDIVPGVANEIRELDEALAGMDTEAAAAAFDVIVKEGLAAGLTIEQISDLFPRYHEELALSARESEAAAGGADGLSDSLDRQTAALQENIDAMRRRRSEALRAADAELNFEEALLDVRKAAKQNENVLKNNGDAMKGSKRAAIEAKRELHALAGAFNEQSDAAKNVPGAHKAAIDAFVDAAVKMGMGKQAAREYARELMEIPSERKTRILVDYFQAQTGIELIGRKLAALDGTEARTYITTVYSDAGFQTVGGLQERAYGGEIDGTSPHKRADNLLIRATAGEWVHQVDTVDYYGPGVMDAINKRRIPREQLLGYAPGGRVGDTPGADYSLDDKLNLLNLEQQIRQLQRDLAKTGEDALKGLEITVAQTELEIARRDMRQARRAPFIEARQGLRDTIGGLRDARGGFDIDADMSVGDVRRELNEFRKAIKEAGGEWTKRLGNMGDRLLKNAQALNKAERAVERETEKRERLQDSLDDQMRSMEDLRRTMDGFASNVAGNFLTNPFGAGYTIPGSPAAAGPVAPDPALIAARDQLGAAESRLAGIRGRTDIDPLTRSYMASKAVAEVAELRSQVEQLDRGAEAIGSLVEPAEKVVSALEAFDEIVRQDIENATKFGGFLDTLASKGLDTKGPRGGLFQELAQSGDLALAGELAGLSPEQIAEYEQLFADRGEAVATVAARATQAVYAEQWAAEQKELRAIQGEMKANARAIERQSNIIERRAERMEAIEERQTEVIANQIGGLRDRIGQLERERETNRQKSGDGKRRR